MGHFLVNFSFKFSYFFFEVINFIFPYALEIINFVLSFAFKVNYLILELLSLFIGFPLELLCLLSNNLLLFLGLLLELMLFFVNNLLKFLSLFLHDCSSNSSCLLQILRLSMKFVRPLFLRVKVRHLREMLSRLVGYILQVLRGGVLVNRVERIPNAPGEKRCSSQSGKTSYM